MCYNESINFSDRIGMMGWKEIRISNLVNYYCFKMVMKFEQSDTGAKHPETLKAYPISFPYDLPETPGAEHLRHPRPFILWLQLSYQSNPCAEHPETHTHLGSSSPHGCSLHGLLQDTPDGTYFSFSCPSWASSIQRALGLPQPIPTSTSAILPGRPHVETPGLPWLTPTSAAAILSLWPHHRVPWKPQPMPATALAS